MDARLDELRLDELNKLAEWILAKPNSYAWTIMRQIVAQYILQRTIELTRGAE